MRTRASHYLAAAFRPLREPSIEVCVKLQWATARHSRPAIEWHPAATGHCATGGCPMACSRRLESACRWHSPLEAKQYDAGEDCLIANRSLPCCRASRPGFRAMPALGPSRRSILSPLRTCVLRRPGQRLHVSPVRRARIVLSAGSRRPDNWLARASKAPHAPARSFLSRNGRGASMTKRTRCRRNQPASNPRRPPKLKGATSGADNQVGCAPYTDDPLPLREFDRLPARVRRAFHAGVLDWDARFAADMVRRRILPAIVAARVVAADFKEIAEFSAAHQKLYGTPTSHVAARATPQPYFGRKKP